jgi:hypothetical protein
VNLRWVKKCFGMDAEAERLGRWREWEVFGFFGGPVWY